MPRHQTRSHRTCCTPDIEETKDHILTAGKELLLAAQGALHFCKEYVEKSVPEARRPALLGFFKKAIVVADELGSSISGISTLKRTAEGFAKPFFTAIEREMREGSFGPHKERSRGFSRRVQKRPPQTRTRTKKENVCHTDTKK